MILVVCSSVAAWTMMNEIIRHAQYNVIDMRIKDMNSLPLVRSRRYRHTFIIIDSFAFEHGLFAFPVIHCAFGDVVQIAQNNGSINLTFPSILIQEDLNIILQQILEK
jgi:hypothetical protein